MFMRFQVQLFDAGERALAQPRRRGLGLRRGGLGAYKTRQSGNTFTITPPRAGAEPYLLRGAVTFEWREDDEVVRHARKSTTAAHPNTAGSDPPGFSSATCTIT